jgi:hypothetical protein
MLARPGLEEGVPRAGPTQAGRTVGSSGDRRDARWRRPKVLARALTLRQWVLRFWHRSIEEAVGRLVPAAALRPNCRTSHGSTGAETTLPKTSAASAIAKPRPVQERAAPPQLGLRAPKGARTMRTSWRVLIVLLAVPNGECHGQEKVLVPDLGKVAEGKGWTVYHATAQAVKADGKSAVQLKAEGDSANGIVGLALADGVEFATGVIEIDLKGKPVRPSFLGVAFNVSDQKTFEAVYFRPFNFKAGGEYKGRAVQYVAWPEFTWEKLRQNRAGRFEGPVRPVTDPADWFHARVEVEAKHVRVYVNGANEPCLTVDRLAEGGKGRAVGLFVDTGEDLYANLKVIPTR